jgi:Leucine-rich repeat (LRR) protein
MDCQAYIRSLENKFGVKIPLEEGSLNIIPRYLEKNNQITELSLVDCKIKRISDVPALSTLTSLETLNLANNQITQIQGLDTLTNLKTLDFQNNNLTEIKGLENLVNIESLYLYGNKIREIRGLDSLKKLRVLILERNEISEIQRLENLPSLGKLDLSWNKITEIKGLDNLKGLRSLYLHRNQITEVKGLENLSSLSSIILSYNPIPNPEEWSQRGQDAVVYCQKNSVQWNRAQQMKAQKEAQLVEKKAQSDAQLLRKFQEILEMTQDVKISRVAEYLEISEKDLFKKLISWRHLGFKIKQECIIVDDIAQFTTALDHQFEEWEQKETNKIGKIEGIRTISEKKPVASPYNDRKIESLSMASVQKYNYLLRREGNKPKLSPQEMIELRKKIDAFIRWIRNPAGVARYLQHYLDINDQKMISKLAMLFNGFRYVFGV